MLTPMLDYSVEFNSIFLSLLENKITRMPCRCDNKNIIEIVMVTSLFMAKFGFAVEF